MTGSAAAGEQPESGPTSGPGALTVPGAGGQYRQVEGDDRLLQIRQCVNLAGTDAGPDEFAAGAGQREIRLGGDGRPLRYQEEVADRLDLRQGFSFGANVASLDYVVAAVDERLASQPDCAGSAAAR